MKRILCHGDIMKTYENLVEKTKDTKEVFAGKMLHAYDDTIILPNGKEATREYVKHIGAVAIVPITDAGDVVIERQYRYPVADVVTEIPAGKLDSPDEDRLLAAKRELKEETGITAEKWIDLGEYHPASAYSTEKITLYMAQGLHRGEQKLDEDEFLNIEEIPLTDLVDQVLDGTITDGKTQVALLKAAEKLGVIRKQSK